MNSFRASAAFFLLLASLGCGNDLSNTFLQPSLTKCPPGTAGIQVGDGFLRITCGCTQPSEAAGTFFFPSNPLTCHLAQRTDLVFFHFAGTTLQHQIVRSSSSPDFSPTPVSNPRGNIPVGSFAIQFSKGFPDTPQTYTFVDQFYPGLTGQIIVP